MNPLVPLLILAPPTPPRNDVVSDAFAAAHAIAVREIADAPRRIPHARFRLLASMGALGRSDLMSLRAGLLLPGPPPKDALRTVTLDFGAVRRLPKGHLAMDASVIYGPRGGFRAHYVVDPSRGPDGAVVSRSVFLRY